MRPWAVCLLVLSTASGCIVGDDPGPDDPGADDPGMDDPGADDEAPVFEASIDDDAGGEAALATPLASANRWNYPNDNFFRCVTLKSPSAPLRYSDFSRISPGAGYDVKNTLSFDEAANVGKGFCKPGQIRLDAFELIETGHGRVYLHKGGQGYTQGSVPYGHIWLGDLTAAASPLRPVDKPTEYGAPSAIGTSGARDPSRRNGRGCTAMSGAGYRINVLDQGSPDALPPTWQYKPNQSTSRFNKYADAGAEQGDGTQHYAYLLWSWLHRADGVTKSPGGGIVRALLKDEQVFYRCAVASIDSVAYAPDSTTEIGRVTAVYGKTRTSATSPWLYGWTIHSHRRKLSGGGYGPRVPHLDRCAPSGC